jgi:hypothetical protein
LLHASVRLELLCVGLCLRLLLRRDLLLCEAAEGILGGEGDARHVRVGFGVGAEWVLAELGKDLQSGLVDGEGCAGDSNSFLGGLGEGLVGDLLQEQDC